MEKLCNLITEAQIGNRDAFGEIVGRFQNMAFGYAVSILSDFDLAQDVVQDAFLEVWRNIRDLREPIAFSAWFRKIVFKHCDRMMRRKHWQMAGLEEAEMTASKTLRQDELLEKSQRQQLVLDAIQALPEKQRTILTLFYIDEHSQKEISEFLETPITTVKKRLFDGRKRLKGDLVKMVNETVKNRALPDDFSEKLLRISFTIESLRETTDEPIGLNLKITNVMGSSKKASPGETYFIQGEYSGNTDREVVLSIVGIGVCKCHTAALTANSGSFEIGTEIMEVWDQKDRILHLELTKDGHPMGNPLVIQLAK